MAEMIDGEERHVVAVVGGATAGSEIARVLASRGALVVVFEQNARPYGKIEDGLPRWHVKQRKDEYAEIDKRLEAPNVAYVPLTALGSSLDFTELRTVWGFSAIVLTNGAWRDRQFPITLADQYQERGLIYQNPLIYWFNHNQQHGYDGPRYELKPGAVVIGGGLASIDVVKVLQIEMTLSALRLRGIEEQMIRLEREGIEPVLQAHGLSWSGLGVAPCKLFYRRRVIDMPLSDIPPNAPPKRADSLRMARTKILEKAQRKYLFEFEDKRVPTGVIVENGRMIGLEISHTEVIEGKAKTLPNSAERVVAPFVISSIGSIPTPIAGIPQKGEVYEYADLSTGLLIDGPTRVYAAGNVLTGKGNIKDSLESGTEIGAYMAEHYLGLADGPAPENHARDRAEQRGHEIAGHVELRAKLAPEAIERIFARVRARQREVGYEGDYRAWLAKVTPADLE